MAKLIGTMCVNVGLPVLLLVSMLSTTAVAAAQQQASRAENIRFELAEGGVVRIFFDLIADNPQQTVEVTVLVSQDGGQTFELTALSMSGDVGGAVAPGLGKRIVWESARDVERLDTDQLRFQIVVDVRTVPEPAEPRSFWGITGSFSPRWTVPSGFGKLAFSADDIDLFGSEFRIGIVRGRPEAGEWGISFVRKRISDGASVSRDSQGFFGPETNSTTTYSANKGVWLTGAEVHTFRPFLRMGGRGQLGVVLAGGLGAQASGTAERRVTGPIFVDDPSTGSFSNATVPVGPGFMVDDQFRGVEVAPGETEAVDTVDATELYEIFGWNPDFTTPTIFGRVELAGAFTVRSDLKIRVSGGFNFPGAQPFSIDAIYFFGRPGQ